MAILTLKNRYPEPFEGRFDGQVYTVADTLAVPDYIAEHLQKQSVVRDNPVTGEREYRLAIIERGDEDWTFKTLPVESLDRSDMDQTKVEIRKTGIRTGVPERKAAGTAVTAKA